MGWRKTGHLQPPQEIQVMTCDVCERDIGHEDGRRPRGHYEIRRLPHSTTFDGRDASVCVCSSECLRAFAARVSSEPDGLPPRDATSV
jgi:hypothetical protein